jgi:hypothetical protein
MDEIKHLSDGFHVSFLLEFTGLQGLIKVYGEWQTGAYMGFEDLCST